MNYSKRKVLCLDSLTPMIQKWEFMQKIALTLISDCIKISTVPFNIIANAGVQKCYLLQDYLFSFN